MTFFFSSARRLLIVAAVALALVSATVGKPAFAQFAPPSLVFGSVTDSAGPVSDGVPVEAYIGETLCSSKGRTEYVGEGRARVTAYVVTVLSEPDRAGCGKDGIAVRIKIGDRFAPQSAKWSSVGYVQLDVTFGNATPAAIPTFTPQPAATAAPGASATAAPGAAATAAPGASAAAGVNTPAAVGTIPAGSPGAGSPVATLKGGVTSSTPAAQQTSTSGDGGFPIWGIVLLGLLGVGAIGGGIGYAMSRSRAADDIDSDDQLPPLE